MKSKITTIIKYTILLGTIAVAMVMLFGQNTSTLLERQIIPNTSLVWYRFNYTEYLQNLTTQITNTTELQLPLPTRNWRTLEGVDWIIDLGNNLALMLDYIILILNVLLYPLKIGGYLINFLLALLGLNVGQDSSLYWLGNLAQGMIGLTIPYV